MRVFILQAALLSSQTQRKMAAGLLFLVCAVAVYSTKAQDSYDGLPEIYKKGVDLAIKQLSTHAKVQHHYRFLRTVEKLEQEDVFRVKYLFHHVHLKPTRCAKGATETDPQRCPFRNDRPLMDCAICFKAFEDQIKNEPNPYVHCIQRPRLTEEMKQARLQHYRQMIYHTGSPTLLSRTSR